MAEKTGRAIIIERFGQLLQAPNTVPATRVQKNLSVLVRDAARLKKLSERDSLSQARLLGRALDTYEETYGKLEGRGVGVAAAVRVAATLGWLPSMRRPIQDLAGWQRLLRAYAVLGQKDKARDALAKAKDAFAGDGSSQAALDDLARSLGLDS